MRSADSGRFCWGAVLLLVLLLAEGALAASPLKVAVSPAHDVVPVNTDFWTPITVHAKTEKGGRPVGRVVFEATCGEWMTSRTPGPTWRNSDTVPNVSTIPLNIIFSRFSPRR